MEKTLNEQPLISVILAIYNVEQFLNQCIESIVCQTYGNIEIILVDDGSKDSSLSICECWKKKDARIILINQENQGLAGARNTGLAACKGEWFYFVDGDDYLERDAIEQAISYINDDIDLVVTDYFVDTASRIWKESFFPFRDKEFSEVEKIELMKNCFLKTPSVNQSTCTMLGVAWAKLYRTEIVKDNNIRFDLRLRKMQDAPFNCEVFHRSRKIKFASIPTYHYRFNNASITHRSNSNYVNVGDSVLVAFKAFINKFGYENELMPVYYARKFMFGCESVKFILILDNTGMSLAQKAKQTKKLMTHFCEKDKKSEMFPYLLKPYKLAYILHRLNAYTLMYLLMKCFYKMKMKKMK